MKGLRKIIASVLSVLMLCSMIVGCGKTPPAGNQASPSATASPQQSQSQTPAPSEAAQNKYQFPLKEKVKISVMTTSPNYDAAQFNQRIFVKETLEKCNIELDFNVINATTSADYVSQLQIRFASNDYSDVILAVADTVLSTYSATGNIIPLEKYITPEITPKYLEAVAKKPSLQKVATDPSGHVYSMPFIIEIYQTWMENNFIINKKWLDTLGLQPPKTTDELYTVLKAFKEKDPNQDGLADEIPFTLLDENSLSANIEAFMGCFGLAYKHGLNDGYTVIKNGKVELAPALPEYKEGMKYLRKLFADGLLDQEVFTQKAANLQAKYQSDVDIIGATVYKDTTYFKNMDHFMVIAPPAAPGIKPQIWVNPGVLGKRSGVVLTDKNKNPEVTMAMLDLLYDTQEYFKLMYADLAYMDGGMLKFKQPPEGVALAKYQGEFAFKDWPGMILEEDIGKKAEMPYDRTAAAGLIEIDRPYFAEQVWPRPQFLTSEIEELVQLRTDLFAFIKSSKAKFITDPKSDIDTEWDNYLKTFENMGSKKYLEIMQTAYDRFNAAQ